MDDKTIENRREIIFLYDVTNANPNGDPDENKPRMDEETRTNLVSDTRLKRTIRDYLERRGYAIFVRDDRESNGDTKKSKKSKVKDDLKEANIKLNDTEKAKAYLNEKYIDLKLFGALLPGDQKKGGNNNLSSMNWVGPVQFKFGHSLNAVNPELMKGTSIQQAEEGLTAGTFTEFWYVPYSMIAFYGIINEEQAKETGIKDDDIGRLRDALWNGTKNLITRSKFGQMPRLLIEVSYDKHYYIGSLDSYISLTKNGKKVETEQSLGFRSIKDFEVDLTEIIALLRKHHSRIVSLNIRADPRVMFFLDGRQVEGSKLHEALESYTEFAGKVSEIRDIEYGK